MSKHMIGLILFLLFSSMALSQETYELWPSLAPGETKKAANKESSPGRAQEVTNPRLLLFQPKEKTTDTCLLLIPGGGYNSCFYSGEGFPHAKWWSDKGVTTAVLIYRVPRPQGKPIYASAWQDGQRAVRFLRANAKKFGINPEKIGAHGYSAGGHLALMLALCSQTPAYEPIDDLDKIPCHINFAIPLYPAYVLDDGKIGPNQEKGNNAKILDTFKFDAKTPPLCLVHGDNDIYSPMGSVHVYHQLRKMNIPCELHIFAKAVHGFMHWNELEGAKKWQDRCYDWMKTMKYLE